MANSRRLPRFLRIAVLLLLLGAAGLLAADVRAARSSQLVHGFGPWLVLAVRDLLVPFAMAVALFAISCLLERGASAGAMPGDLAPVEAHRLTDSIDEVRVAVANLSLALKTRTPPSAGGAGGGSSAGPLPAAGDQSQTLNRVVALLEEIRQLTLLDEAGRAARLKEQRQSHKAAALAEAKTLADARRWAEADGLLQGLERELPGDGDILAARRELADRRGAVEGDAILRARSAVEDWMAIGNWDQALAAARELAKNFPENPDAAALEARVLRERELFEENAAQRLFEELKQATERRQWQRAQAAAHQLLERFPGHRRTEKVRGQWETIQSNAEIERRQEAEAKLQDLIRSKRFTEAVALAEEILEKYPHSPQADSLEEMLPKMRAMAIEQELDAEVT